MLSLYLEAATSILAYCARVTGALRFMLPYSSPTMMPRAFTVRITAESSSSAKAGTESAASSTSASSSANKRFFITAQLLSLFVT